MNFIFLLIVYFDCFNLVGCFIYTLNWFIFFFWVLFFRFFKLLIILVILWQEMSRTYILQNGFVFCFEVLQVLTARVEHYVCCSQTEWVVLTVFYQVKTFLPVVIPVLLLDNLALLIKQLLFQVLHNGDVLFGVSNSASFLNDLLAKLIDLDRIAAQKLNGFLLEQFLEKSFKLFEVVSYSPLHTWIPMVLDCIVSSTLQNIGDVCPLVRLVSVQQKQDPLFLSRPWRTSLNHWIQMVVPTFSTLLPDSTWQVICDLCPLLRPINIDQMKQQSIFNISPRSFNKSWV